MNTKNKNSLFTFLMLIVLTCTTLSCSKKEKTSSSTSPVGTADGPINGGGNNSGTTDGGSTTSTLTCNGDTSDGVDDNPGDLLNHPLHIYQIALGGQKSWIPGNPGHRPEDKEFLHLVNQPSCEPLACIPAEMADRTKRSNRCYYCLKKGTGTNATYENTPYSDPTPLKKDVWSLSNNDGDIFFRVKIRSPSQFNLNGYGGAFCYGRDPNQYGSYVPYTTPYTKIKVDIYARVLRKTTNCDVNSNCTEADFTLTATRLPIKVGIELDVNKCSTILRLPFSSIASTGADAVVLEFANVQTNVSCSAESGKFCALNTANCWFATLQIATNETDFFRGSTRSSIGY